MTVPPHLHPLDGPLGANDMVLSLRVPELLMINEAMVWLDRQLEAGSTPLALRIVHRDGSPWVEFAVAVGPVTAIDFDRARRLLDNGELARRVGTHRFALWRYTLAVYRVGDDGAVEDDPIG
jgi:hypothetical protein